MVIFVFVKQIYQVFMVFSVYFEWDCIEINELNLVVKTDLI